MFNLKPLQITEIATKLETFIKSNDYSKTNIEEFAYSFRFLTSDEAMDLLTSNPAKHIFLACDWGTEETWKSYLETIYGGF